MINLSKIKQHPEYTQIFISRVAIPGVRITLELNGITDCKIFRYHDIPPDIKIPENIRLDPDNNLIENKPVLLISHYDPDEFSKLIWDMLDDDDVIAYRDKLNELGTIDHETCYKHMEGNML